jgi:hypothetical protein
MKGIIQITGVPGVGKTSLALEAGFAPKEISVMNFDVKPYDLKDEFAFYRDYNHIVVDFGNSDPQMKMVESVVKDFDTIKGGKCLILDGYELFQKAFGLWAEKDGNMRKYRKSYYAKAGKQAVLEKRGYVKFIEAGYFSALQSKFEVIFVINHLADEWKNDKKTGRMIPMSTLATTQKSMMRLWVVETPGHRCPTALVIKEPAQHVFVDGRIRTMPFLPPRVSPYILSDLTERTYVSFWDAYEYYKDNPVGHRALRDFEKLSELEEELVASATTATFDYSEKDEVEERAKKALAASDESVVSYVKENKDSPPAKIFMGAKKLNGDVTIDVIKEILENLN